MTAALPIPDDCLDDRLAFVGTSGSGKTFAAKGRVERLLKKKHRVVVIDPLDVWYGLRLGVDGKSPGFDVAIFGGKHADLPLNEHAGGLIGEAIATSSESCIVALSGLRTSAARQGFMLAFLEALYERTDSDRHDPYHVVFDEADLWAPQKPMGPEAMLCHLTEEIVRRGRVKGFIPWLITQRPAVLNKNVLSQADGLVAMSLTSSQDRDAIDAWVEGQADRGELAKVIAELPGLRRGHGIVWIPRAGILETAAFPLNATFDSSRTPKRGEKKRNAVLAPFNMDALKGKLAKVEAEVKANDPAALKAKVAELTRALAAEQKKKAPAPTAIASVTAPAKPAGPRHEDIATIKVLRGALETAMKFIIEINARGFDAPGIDKAEIEKALATATAQLERLIERNLAQRTAVIDRLRLDAQRVAARLKALLENDDCTLTVDVRHNEPFTVLSSEPRPMPKPGNGAAPPSPALASLAAEGDLTGPQRALLRALAWWRAMGHERVTRTQAAAMCGWATTGSNIRDRLSELRRAGLVEDPAPGLVALTPAGATAAPPPDLDTTLVASIRGILTAPQRALFDALHVLNAPVPRADLAARLGWEPAGSNIRDRLSELRRLDIVKDTGRAEVALADWVV